jgi:hypothetical protein
LISVFRGSDYVEAHLLAGLLRQQGIETFLQGALLQGGLGELPALGHLTIMVDEEDREAAKRLIAAYERGELKIDEHHLDAWADQDALAASSIDEGAAGGRASDDTAAAEDGTNEDADRRTRKR